MRPSPYSHAIAKVPAQFPAAVTPTPVSSRDAPHGFSRSLRARVAGPVEKSRRARRDEGRSHLWRIVPVARRLSWFDAWDARMLRCYARRKSCRVAPGMASKTVSVRFYSFVACHRPLHGFPAAAAFHLPEPILPPSCPNAYAPFNVALTMPSCATVPKMSAGPEIFPS